MKSEITFIDLCFHLKEPNGDWIEQIVGTSWLHFLFEVSLILYIVFLGVHGMNRPSKNPLQESLNILTAKVNTLYFFSVQIKPTFGLHCFF